MSRLLDHLQVYETNDRKYIPQPLKMVEAETTSYDLRVDNFATVYRVRAVLGSQVVVSDEMKQSLKFDFRQLLKEKVYQPLAEEVFGEFRKPLIDADLAIMQGEYMEASRLIKSVLDSMFKV